MHIVALSTPAVHAPTNVYSSSAQSGCCNSSTLPSPSTTDSSSSPSSSLLPPVRISFAIFSARASTTSQSAPLTRTRADQMNLQTVACGCPGGKNGNALASTTLKPCTPKTLASESTTARRSPRRPIAHVALT